MSSKRTKARLPKEPPAGPREQLDQEVGRTIREYENHIRGKDPYRVLAFGARAADRVRGIDPLGGVSRPAEATELLSFLEATTDSATWLAGVASVDAGRARSNKLRPIAEQIVEMLEEVEYVIYRADLWSESILEMGRVAVRLAEVVQRFYDREEKTFAWKVASVAAHAVTLAGLASEKAGTLVRTSISDDLAALSRSDEGGQFPALSAHKEPEWYQQASGSRPLSSAWDRGNQLDVARIKNIINREPEGLEALRPPKVVPELEEVVSDKDVVSAARHVESEMNKLQQEQIRLFQGFLNSIAGQNFESQSIHKNLALLVTQLAAKANATLTISGEYPDPKAGIVNVYSMVPVTIRCDQPKTKKASFVIRTANYEQAYVASSPQFPQLYAVPKT